MDLRQGALVLLLAAMLLECEREPSVLAAVAQASPTPTVAAQPSPVPTPEAEQAYSPVLFYDLTAFERTCPGYQEYRSFGDRIAQVKITCTGPGVETVYFIDVEKQLITGVRMPLVAPGQP
jgi:hypothetical protein